MIYLFLLIFNNFSYTINYEYVYRNTKDSTFNCYLLTKPDNEIKGLVIRDFSSLPDTSKKNPYLFESLCSNNGLMTAYIVSSKKSPELFYFYKDIELLDEIINEIIDKYNISKKNIFIGGISASGTRALRYAQYCNSGNSKYKTKINGVFSVDSPLDIERFYLSAKNNKKFFKKGMLLEANFVLEKFKEYLGEYNSEKYQNSSVFSNFNIDNENYKLLLNTSLLFFHEPDIDWWLNERGSTYFDINSYDITNVVRLLKDKKHNDITLITTSQKGFNRKGERNCHSWSIVDEEYLTRWIIERMN